MPKVKTQSNNFLTDLQFLGETCIAQIEQLYFTL